MKLLQGKWMAGVLSLAFVVSCMGGCAPKPAGSTTGGTPETSAPAASEPAPTEETGVDVPEPDAADGEAKPE